MRDVVYSRYRLLSLRSSTCRLDEVTRQAVLSAGLRRQRSRPRGCRAGKHKRKHCASWRSADQQPIPVLSVSDRRHGTARVNGRSVSSGTARQRVLTTVRRQRHDHVSTRSMNFACLNIRSLHNKLDDVLEVRRDYDIDVLFLVETWHDPDSVCVRRLRADGCQVVDVARPRAASDSESVATNHGGIVAATFTGARLVQLDIGATPTSFEYVCSCVIKQRIIHCLCHLPTRIRGVMCYIFRRTS